MTDEEDVNPPKRFDIEEPDESSDGIKIIPPDDLYVNPPKRFDIEEPDESLEGIEIVPPDDLSGEEESETGSQEQTKRAS